MKTQFFSIALSLIFLSLGLFVACNNTQVRHYTVDLLHADGTKETYTLHEGSMLLVNDGDRHLVAKAVTGTGSELELEVTQYAIEQDSVKGAHTIRKAGAQTQKIALNRKTTLDPAGTVQVNLQTIAMMDTGRRPQGACLGKCCEATCFSTFCCGDQHECKDTPCDCKPPSNCPGPQPGVVASHFFELFLSGKELMVFPDDMKR